MGTEYSLLVPVEECIFNDQSNCHEDPIDYLRELICDVLLTDKKITEDDYVIVNGYDAVAIEEGFVVFRVEWELNE